MKPIFPKSILDVQDVYRTTDIYLRLRYPCPSPCPSPIPSLALAEVRQYIGRGIYVMDVRPIYILDVQYRFRKYWCHFVSNRAPYKVSRAWLFYFPRNCGIPSVKELQQGRKLAFLLQKQHFEVFLTTPTYTEKTTQLLRTATLSRS